MGVHPIFIIKYSVLLQVNNIARPAEYESAVRAKETAREDITVSIEECAFMLY